jgi:hypothetical protein
LQTRSRFALCEFYLEEDEASSSLGERVHVGAGQRAVPGALGGYATTKASTALKLKGLKKHKIRDLAKDGTRRFD